MIRRLAQFCKKMRSIEDLRKLNSMRFRIWRRLSQAGRTLPGKLGSQIAPVGMQKCHTYWIGDISGAIYFRRYLST